MVKNTVDLWCQGIPQKVLRTFETIFQDIEIPLWLSANSAKLAVYFFALSSVALNKSLRNFNFSHDFEIALSIRNKKQRQLVLWFDFLSSQTLVVFFDAVDIPWEGPHTNTACIINRLIWYSRSKTRATMWPKVGVAQTSDFL